MTDAPPSPTPDQILMQLATGKWVARALGAVAALRIADAFVDGPNAVEDLAEKTGTNPDALYRTLRALASVGVFEEAPQRRFALTPVSAPLRSDHPQSMRATVHWLMEPAGWRGWSDYEHALRTGEPSFEKELGAPFFRYIKEHPETARVFHEAMAGFSVVTGEAVAEAYDFSKVRHVVDVGGGHGVMLAAIVRRYPEVRATLFDLPEVTAEAPAALAARGVAEPLEIVGGDFFERVPAGADAYVMKMVLHDWDDDRAAAILVRCREAMARGGRVLICEQVIGVGADLALLTDLEMLIMTPGGRERTGAEFATLAARAGLRIRRFVPTTSPIVVIECVGA
jgi:hypothetical protein